LRPGQRGTKLLREYGDRLVCVRYRYDEQNARRLKTVELVVEAVPWWPGGYAAAHRHADVRPGGQWSGEEGQARR